MLPIYNFDVEDISYKLTPPELRQPAHLSWLKVILRPLQELWSSIFEDYSDGVIATYPLWDIVTGYTIGTKVIFSGDKGVYVCILGAGGLGQTPVNPLYWTKIQDNFIGANERIKYNSQIIVLEYALNLWFLVPTTDPQIYIENNDWSPPFLMGEENTYLMSSNLADNSIFSDSAMGNTFTGASEFTIYFPVLLFAALSPALTSDKEKVIRNFVDKYRMAGITYTITTY